MGVIFDILGSFIVRAAIIIIVLHLMLTLHETLYSNTDRIYLNEVMKAPSETMSYDLKLAGYNALKTFSIAQKNLMLFYADIDNDGSQESIRYSIFGGILYRRVNFLPAMEIARNVKELEFKYFDISGNLLAYTNPRNDVKSIKVTLVLQSTNTVTSAISGTSDAIPKTAKWEIQIFPLNL